MLVSSTNAGLRYALVTRAASLVEETGHVIPAGVVYPVRARTGTKVHLNSVGSSVTLCGWWHRGHDHEINADVNCEKCLAKAPKLVARLNAHRAAVNAAFGTYDRRDARRLPATVRAYRRYWRAYDRARRLSKEQGEATRARADRFLARALTLIKEAQDAALPQ